MVLNKSAQLIMQKVQLFPRDTAPFEY